MLIKVHLESGEGDADKDVKTSQGRFPVILRNLGLGVPYHMGTFEHSEVVGAVIS